MIRKIVALYKRFREQIHYMIFGGLTTAVNMIAYYFLMFIPWFNASDNSVSAFGREYRIGYLVANAIAFVVAVIFSYWANRNFVFRHKVHGFGAVAAQFLVFLGTRVLSFFVEEILLFTAVEKLAISEYVAKWPVAIFVVLINYTFGKLVVFRKPKCAEDAPDDAETAEAAAPEEPANAVAAEAAENGDALEDAPDPT